MNTKYIVQIGSLFLLLTLFSNAEKKDYYPGEETESRNNMKVNGIPDSFMNLIMHRIRIKSNDVIHPDRLNDKKIQLDKVIKTIKVNYPDNAENYFLRIVNTTESPILRTATYNIFLETGLNNGAMLNYSRKSLKQRNWEDGQQLSITIRHQMRVLVAYGDESDLVVWGEIWDRMGEHERHSFKAYRKMLIKALEKRNKHERLRAAQGDKQAQRSLLGEDSENEESESSILYNTKLHLAIIIILGFVFFYVKLRMRKK